MSILRDAGALALAFAIAGLGCKGPMARIEALRDALVADDASAIRGATNGYPSCLDPAPVSASADAPCLSAIANAIGSKHGFVANPPDHAAAATVALVLLRDGRGDLIARPDDWLADLKNGKGIGHDVLRLAVARRMVDASAAVGRKIDDDAAARAALLAIAAAIPGACPTYRLVGMGTDPKAMPPELSADHAACVQKDLARREGPGGAYGSGTPRATEGALALWREAERALRLGLPNADQDTKAVLQKKLTQIERATRSIETVKMEPATASATMSFIGEAHAEAGVVLFKTTDAGKDAASR
jgi:hypothetical protein